MNSKIKVPKNVMVLGCSGGGKSTLATSLACILRLKPIHLDHFLWLPEWQQRDAQEMMQMVDEAIINDGWVTDGNHRAGNYEERVRRADMLVWVDIPRWRCLYNILVRFFKYRGIARPSMTVGCNERLNLEFLSFIWNFKKNKGFLIEQLFETHKHTKQVIRLKNYREMNAFENEMKIKYGK